MTGQPVAHAMQLDALDSAILSALLGDARLSLREVARRVDSTATTVAARLSRLEDAGIILGASLRLAPDAVPGRTRLVTGQVAPEHTERLFAAAARIDGITELAVDDDGALWVIVQVADLDAEADLLKGLSRAGARGLSARPAQRREGPPLRHLFQGAAVVQEPCAECGKAVVDAGVVERVDGRRVVFCCASCRRLYLDRYAQMKAKAGGPSSG